MKLLKYTWIAILTAIVIYSCAKKEAALTPSDIKEYGYFLPQGNSDFDQRIMNYYTRFGSTLLYQFTPRDAYYSILKWDSTYRVLPADPAYINKQLDLLDTTFFRYYTDDFLRLNLPSKFLLCSSVKTSSSTSAPQVDGYYAAILPNGNTTGPVFQTFIANWGSSRIDTMGKISIDNFRGGLNYGFLRLLQLANKTSMSDAFINTTDYTTLVSTTTQSARYNRGFLSTTATTAPPSAATDWAWFIHAIVKNPYTYLTNATGMTSNNTSYQGILTPVKDSSGLIRKKYDAITNFYKDNYNIDLQKIGNGDK